MRWQGVSAMVAAAVVLTAAAPGAERRLSVATASRGDAPFRSAMLDGHNQARAAIRVAPLAWNDRLAADARAHAERMARTGRLAHADPGQRVSGQGENLWAGTRNAYGYREMVGHWVAEQRHFVNAAAPRFSRTGQWSDVAHYTQVVWRGSTEVGCAIASNGRDDYVACRYAPSGNVVGQRAY